MCTFSLIRLAPPHYEPGYRLVFNRDEQRTRPPGIPPAVDRFGDRRGILPRDPVANGTWIGVNDAGLAIALLNVYPPDAAPAAARPLLRGFRGLIIPSLLHAVNAAQADAEADAIELPDYPPFTLMIVDRDELRSRRWDGATLTCRTQPLAEAPFLAVSSGLGDRIVEPPRRRLFEELLGEGDPATLADRQDAYHRHRWPDHPELSVSMARSDACTMSCTWIAVSPHQVELTYHPAPPDQPATPVTLRLPAACP